MMATGPYKRQRIRTGDKAASFRHRLPPMLMPINAQAQLLHYFPIQNLEKISPSKSSGVKAPVIWLSALWA